MPDTPQDFVTYPQRAVRPGGFSEAPLARFLVERDTLSAQTLVRAMGAAQVTGAPLPSVLRSEGALPEPALLEALGRSYGLPVLDPQSTPADADLAGLLSPAFCLRHGIWPWYRRGDVIVIACCRPESLSDIRALLPPLPGPVRLALAPESAIQEEIAAQHGAALVQEAETWVRAEDSCRDFNRLTPVRAVVVLGAATLSIAGMALAPDVFILVAVAIALLSMVLAQALKAAALCAGHTRRPRPVAPVLGDHPMVSLLVPLFRETDIAGTLVARLARLRYPKARLEALLILEAGDTQTRQALNNTDLPPWMRVIEVPPGSVTTKPRALNYAFRFARGDIIGIYDAEDAPDADQIDQMVARFRTAPPDVACLQGILDFYNPRANWLSRCFAVEYATWFRVLLPGLVRLGLAIPLGGTSVFFRRAALERVQGWDAHNVTEDADLGLRLARHGYRTEVVASVTREEANNRAWPWIRQRSRWLKGYMITYLVHMRRPRRLWRDLGAWRFVGVQLVFLTAILQFTLAPALWSFWLIMLGVGHPAASLAPAWLLDATLWLFLGSELVALLAAFAAVARTPHLHLMLWVPTMMLYYPLAVIAAYKALWELATRPFYWDKTAHGVSAPDAAGSRENAGSHKETPAPEFRSRRVHTP